MDFFKATITIFKPGGASVHDRHFARAEDAVQTFRNILSAEGGVSFVHDKQEVYDKHVAMKHGAQIAELRVLKLPLYDTARASLDF